MPNYQTLTVDSTGFSAGLNNTVLTRFNHEEIEIEQGDIVSNVLKIFNNSNDTLRCSIDFLTPNTWKTIDFDTAYKAGPKDTLFVPVVIIPQKSVKGNAEVIVNAFVLDDENRQIANNFFTVSTKKHVSWKLKTVGNSTHYFKNDEDSKAFQINIKNTGNSKQDVFVHYKTIRDNLLLKDTANHIVKKSHFTVGIEEGMDTTFTYVASIVSDKVRNHRKISSQGYDPNNNIGYQKYKMHVETSEPNTVGDNVFQQGTNINFIKLPNETKAQNFKASSAPLVAEASIQNLWSDTPFMSLNLTGMKDLGKTASLSYFTQFNYSKVFYSNNFLKNSPWYIGYFDSKKSIEIGQINANIAGGSSRGKGIKVSYALNHAHRTTAFYVKSPYTSSYGLGHSFRVSKNLSLSANLAQQVNSANKQTFNTFSLGSYIRFFRHHSLRASGTTMLENTNDALNDYVENPIEKTLLSSNYSGNFLNKKLRITLGGKYRGKNFGFAPIERENFNFQSNYYLDKNHTINFNTNYLKENRYNRFTDTPISTSKLVTNRINLSTPIKNGSMQYGLFYDYQEAFRVSNFRGANIQYGCFDFKNNFLNNISFRAGYTEFFRNDFADKHYFSFEFHSIVNYRTWGLTSYYNYGIFSVSNIQYLKNTGITPQQFRLSLRNQYQFKNRHFVIESGLNYSYNNTLSNHRIGLFPEVFYYANNGWQFAIQANYVFSTRKFELPPYSNLTGVSLLESPERTSESDFNVGVRIRKEFGIPIPFAKKSSVDVNLISFYDINGNGIKEENEPAIEDVVVGLGDIEVITNSNGRGRIENMPLGQHALRVLPLDDLKAWFPNIESTILVAAKGDYYIPFTRGVKVYGDVILNRQKIAISDTTRVFDLSRIKVTATNQSNGKVYETLTNIKGDFELYIPNGDYVISMDNQVLTDRYQLTRNHIPMQLTKNQSDVYVSFYIIEKRKKVKVKTFGGY